MTDPIERYLHEHIPMSKYLGVTVIRATDEVAVLSAPLQPNLNHEANAFGGSLSAVAILAGWTFLFQRLPNVTEARRIVIQHSHVEYLTPVQTDFTATCVAPAPETWERFREGLNRRGKARIELSVSVEADGARCAQFEGTYVTMVTSPSVS